MGPDARADSGLNDRFALQYHPHTCLQHKHVHIREMLVPTKSAELLAAA